MHQGFGGPTDHIVRFDTFEVDLRSHELRKRGRRIRLPGLPFEVLAALLEHPGELVGRDELRQRLWSDGTVVDFDNNLNSAVNRLRHALGDSAENPTFIETLPRRGYRFKASVESSLDEEPRKDEGVRSPTFFDEASRPRLSLVVLVVLVAALAVVVVTWRLGRGPETNHSGRAMLAVLPFTNLTGDREQEYMSDGLTEEMITELSRLAPERLGIIARTSAFRYRGTEKSVEQIGRELGVDFIVQGSVRRVEDRVRINAQLIDAREQTHVWANSYDREAHDLLSLEEDVAREIAEEIRLVAEPRRLSESASLVNPKARDVYLRARYHHSQGTVHGLEKAIELYGETIEAAPSFARAHAGLARSYIFGVRIEPKAALGLAYEEARRAKEIDADLPEAQIAWAMVKLYAERDLPAARIEFQRALELDPGNADAHFYSAHCLAAMGHFDEAIASARRAQQLDPFSALINHYVGRLLYFAGRYDEAMQELEATLELEPNYPWAHLFLAVVHERMGSYDDAVAHRQKYWSVMDVSPERVTSLGDVYNERGYSEVLKLWAEWIEGFARQNGYVTSTELALLHTALEDREGAFYWLEKAYEHGTRDLIYLAVDPAFDRLRPDPRFQRLVRVLGRAGDSE